MNRYIEENRAHAGERVGGVAAVRETVLTWLDALLAVLLSPSTRTAVRVMLAVVSFFGFLSVIAAVEAETIAFSTGILLTAALFGIAALALRRRG